VWTETHVVVPARNEVYSTAVLVLADPQSAGPSAR
jgi:hypothetical protein